MAPREQPFSVSSTTLSVLVVSGLLLMGFLPLVSKSMWVGPVAKPVPESTDQQPRQAAAPGSRDNWTEAEIAHGREECMHLLQSVAADVDVLAPIKRAECGLPAPVRLKSLGSNPQVIFEPPVIINCRMMAALFRWNKSTLQPAARSSLGSSVTRIVGASGYSCRNVYNLPDRNLSQHAFANAIDIAAFELKDGRKVSVLNGWGPTTRDLAALAKTKSDLGRPKSPPGGAKEFTTTKTAPPAAGRDFARASLLLRAPSDGKPERSGARLIRLPGGVWAPKPTVTTKFLTSLHRGACQEFETVLGPEANEIHRNHFHFDLAPLRNQAYCE
jgi:hypothetical protein